MSFFADYGGRRRSEDFSPTGLEEWAVTKANSLRLKKHAHHHHHHHQPQQPPHAHVIEAASAATTRPRATPISHANNSISNQNITNVDSIEILPIFHKLLEDKQRNSSDCAFKSIEVTTTTSNKKNRFHSARSCPDMSVRCDIVEYL